MAWLALFFAGLFEIVAGKTETGQHPANFRLHLVATTFLEQVLQFGIAFHLHFGMPV